MIKFSLLKLNLKIENTASKKENKLNLKLTAAWVKKIELPPKYILWIRHMNRKEKPIRFINKFLWSFFWNIKIKAQMKIINEEGKKFGRKKTHIENKIPIRKIGLELSNFFSKQRTR